LITGASFPRGRMHYIVDVEIRLFRITPIGCRID